MGARDQRVDLLSRKMSDLVEESKACKNRETGEKLIVRTLRIIGILSAQESLASLLKRAIPLVEESKIRKGQQRRHIRIVHYITAAETVRLVRENPVHDLV